MLIASCDTIRFRGHQAFTMIELMVVMVILAIASALAVPYIARSDSFAAQGAARALIGDLLFAQNDAISQQQTRRVIFDLNNQTYRLADGASQTLEAAWLGGNYVVSFGQGTQWPNVRIQSVSFTSARLDFDDLGTPSEGGTVELTAGGERYVITVTPLTGRISVTGG